MDYEPETQRREASEYHDHRDLPSASLIVTRHIAGVEVERAEINARADTPALTLELFRSIKAEWLGLRR